MNNIQQAQQLNAMMMMAGMAGEKLPDPIREKKVMRKKTAKYYWRKVRQANDITEMTRVQSDLYLDRSELSMNQSLKLRFAASRKMAMLEKSEQKRLDSQPVDS